MIKTISGSAKYKAGPTGKNMKGVLLCITTTKWKHSIFIFYLTGNFLFLTTPMLANKKSLSVVYTWCDLSCCWVPWLKVIYCYKMAHTDPGLGSIKIVIWGYQRPHKHRAVRHYPSPASRNYLDLVLRRARSPELEIKFWSQRRISVNERNLHKCINFFST